MYIGWLQNLVDDDSSAAENLLRAIELFARADEINAYLWAATASIELLEKVDRVQEAVKTYQEVMDALADPRNRDRIPPNIRDTTTLITIYSVSSVYLNQGHWPDAVYALRSIRGQFDARGFDLYAGKVHLNLAHVRAHLGEDAEAASEYRTVLTLEGRIPSAMLEEARASLEVLCRLPAVATNPL